MKLWFGVVGAHFSSPNWIACECNWTLKCRYGFNFFHCVFKKKIINSVFLVLCFVTCEFVLKFSIVCCANAMALTWSGKCKMDSALFFSLSLVEIMTTHFLWWPCLIFDLCHLLRWTWVEAKLIQTHNRSATIRWCNCCVRVVCPFSFLYYTQRVWDPCFINWRRQTIGKKS